MIKKLTASLFFTLGVLLPQSVGATDLQFTQVEARGTGCPLGTTDIITSPDGKSVSLLFNEMYVELPQFDGNNDNDSDFFGHSPSSRFNQNLVQKVCQILVEANLPPEHKVDRLEVKIDFRGSTFMDSGAEAFFHSQLVSYKGPLHRQKVDRRDFVARKIWREGPVDDDWTISAVKNIRINGNCSRHGDQKAQFNLRNILRAELFPHGGMDPMVFIGLDSADFVGKLDVVVHSSPCGGPGGRPTRPLKPQPPHGGGWGRPTRPGRDQCPRGLIFHHPSGRCLSKGEISRGGGRGRGPRWLR